MANRIGVDFVANTAGWSAPIRHATEDLATGSRNMKQSLDQLGAGMGGVGKNASTLQDSYRRVAQAQIQTRTEVQALHSAYRAEAISLVERNARIMESRTALRLVTQEHNAQIAAMRSGAAVATGVAGSTRAGMQQLSYQISDVATQFAMGTRASLIFAQQGGQVVNAIQLMSGSATGFTRFLAGPWGAAIAAGVSVVGALVTTLYKAEDAVKKVEFATYAMKDAQGILGSIMDMTTGKINTQSTALIALARAQLAVAQIESRQRLAEAQGQMAQGIVPFVIGRAASGQGITGVERQAWEISQGRGDTNKAIQDLERMQRAGQITEDQFIRFSKAVSSVGVEYANQQVFKDAQALLDGTGGRGLLTPSTGGGTGGRSGGRSGGPSADDRTENQFDRYNDQLLQIQNEELALRRAGITDITELKMFDAEQLSIAMARKLLDIQKQINDNEITAIQGQEIQTRMAVLNALKQQEIDRRAAGEQIRAEAQLYQAVNDNAMELLDAQLAIADSSDRRRELTLELLALEKEQVRIQAQTVIDLAKRGEATAMQAQAAQDALNNLDALYGAKETSARRSTAGPLEQYRDSLLNSSGKINDAIQAIEVRGLESLNDGLVDALMGIKSLGDVFKSVANQIIADLLRIAVQRAVIEPLANAIFGGSSSSGGGIFGGGIFGLGGLFGGGGFGGFFAEGGDPPVGIPSIVGEKGPELFVPKFPGTIMPNSVLDGLAANDTGPGLAITINAPGATAETVSMIRREIRNAAPALVQAAQQSTIRKINRPGLP